MERLVVAETPSFLVGTQVAGFAEFNAKETFRLAAEWATAQRHMWSFKVERHA